MTTPVTLVVGAAHGIGRATALRLADSGHRVVLADQDLDGLRETVEMLEGDIPSYPLDIRDRDAVNTVIRDIESNHGPIEGLAHVAGVFSVASILDCDPDEWQRIHDINVTGLVSVLRAVGRVMRDRRSGSIVVVGSNSAGVPRMGMGAYGSSKAAATMLVRILGLELAQYGIRANIVAPGSTDTAMQRTLWADPDDNDGALGAIAGDLAQFKVGIPLGRIADPVDIADSIEFLLSPRARHITMQTLYVDGGATLRA